MYRLLCLLLVYALLVVSCRHSTGEQKLLLTTADSLMQTHPDKSFLLLKKISSYKQLSSSNKAQYALLMTEALFKNDFKVESDTLIKYATGYYNNSDPLHAGYAWYYLSRCEQDMGNAQGQAEALLKAQEYALLSQNPKLQSFIWDAKSLMYKEQNKLDSMFYYTRLAYHAFQQQKDIRNAVVCLMNIGVNYSMSEKMDSALHYYFIALGFAKQVNEPLLITSVYRAICYAYYKKGEYQKALQNSRLSIQTSDKYDYSKWMNMAYVYLKVGQLDSVRYYLQKCAPPPYRLTDYYELWEGLYEKQGNFKAALDYEKKLFFTQDSLNKHALNESFAGLDKRYNYQKFQSENKTLTIHNQSKNILILILLLLLSSGVALFFIFKNRQHRKLLEHQRLLTIKEEALVKQEQEKNLILKKQFDIQQNALIAISLLKQNASTLIKKEESIFKNLKQKKEFTTQQDEALSSLYKNVIENVDLLYNNISKRLISSYPQLLESDILICCLLLAGFDNIAIASLLDILPKSYNMRRTLLRKKLNVSHEVNLTDFLVDF